MSFRILGLAPDPFRDLLDADPETLRERGVECRHVPACPQRAARVLRLPDREGMK